MFWYNGGMKRIFIIHGWGGNPDEKLLVWLDQEFRKLGHEVIRPAMPDPENPKIEVWIPELARLVGRVDENTFFIGHSIGCQTIMRYLETLLEDERIGGSVFIAGWFNLAHLKEYDGEDAEEIGKPWIENPINFERIKKVCPKTTVFISTNEPYEYVEENKKTFEEKLDAKVILMENMGHFTEEDGVIELPKVIEIIN